MHRRLNLVLGAVVAWLGLAVPGARADLIQTAEPIHWGYGWTVNPSTLYADNPAGGKLLLLPESGATAAGSSDIVAADLQLVSSADDAHPAKVTNKAYTLELTLTDAASHAHGSLTFDGIFDGTFSKLTSNLTNTFTGQTTQTLHLGGNLYTVTIGPYTPPEPPDGQRLGAIGAHADVSVRPSPTPEPSTLVLAALAATALGVVLGRHLLAGRWEVRPLTV
jgi:hypothetical protein